MEQHGFEDVFNLTGGYKTWEHATEVQSNEDIFGKLHLGRDDVVYSVDPARFQKSGDMVQVDARGLQCPGPIMRVKNEMENLKSGQIVQVQATDPGFRKDVKSWANMTGNHLLSLTDEAGVLTAQLQKGSKSDHGFSVSQSHVGLSMIVFSADFDKALAAFILANGALSAGKEVNLFFTFWGLNVIKKDESSGKKDFMSRMFAAMMPKNSKKLQLSKMHMAGIGTKMMRKRMKDKNIDSLETMIENAIEGGANLTACQMSMDMMGVSRDELIDGVDIGGVASFMESASKTNMNMFV